MRKQFRNIAAGATAGVVNGLFGAGGGMVLVPLLRRTGQWEEREIFAASVCIILPMCLMSLGVSAAEVGLPWMQALPYLAGSAVGGILSATLGKKIPTLWLHRILGLMILWGGIRYLW